MKKRYVHVVLDESGSMYPRRQETISGYNDFLNELKEYRDDVYVSLTLFNTEFRTVYSCVPLYEAEYLDENMYAPNGYTALLDAMGNAISEVDQMIVNGVEKPHHSLNVSSGITYRVNQPVHNWDKILIVVFTDGEENSSKEWNYEKLKNRIQSKQADPVWDFRFFGADIDAFAVGANIGLNRVQTVNISNSASGYREMYANTVSTLYDDSGSSG